MSDTSLEKVLIIDDNSDYRKLIKTFISKLLPNIEVIEYDPVFEGVPGDDFNWSGIDVLLLDYHLSIVGTTGLDILHKHHKKNSFPATIMLTGAGTEEIAIRALKTGIYEYQPKQSLTKDKLKQSIIHAWEDKKEARKKQQEITQHNKSFSKEIFYENLENAYGQSGAERALVVIKPDNLETLEAEIGVIGRDNLVKHIAKNSFDVFKLGACNPNITRISDTEIGVQIDYPNSHETLEFNMQGLAKHLSKCAFKYSDEKYKFSVSIGVLKLGFYNESAERLIFIATQACDHASKTQGNSFYIWKDTDVVPEKTDDAKIDEITSEEENLKSSVDEAKAQAELKEKLKSAEDAKAKAEEALRKATEIEEQAKAKAEEEAKLRAELEAKAKAEAEARLKAEEEARIRAEEEAKLRAELEEEARLKAEAEAKAKAEEEARLKAEAEAKAEEEARLKAEAEAKAEEERQWKLQNEKAEQEEARLKAEEEARLKAEAEAKAKAEEEARLKAEAEAKAKAEEEARLKAEAEAKAKAEEETRLKAEAEAKAKAEEEIKAVKEEKEKLEAELKAIAEAKAKAEAEMKAAKEEKEKLETELKASKNKEAIEEKQKPSAANETKPTPQKLPEDEKPEIKEETEDDSKEIENQIAKLFDEKRIIQTYQPVTDMFGDENETREIYKIGLQAISENEEINKSLIDISNFSIPLQQSINEWTLRQVFLRITESGTENCQYLFLITVTESWFSDITLFQWLQKILSQTKKYNPGKSIILDVPLDIYIEHQKRAEALIKTLRKSHQFTVALSNVFATDDFLNYCELTSSNLLIMDVDQLKKLSTMIAPEHNENKEEESDEEAEKQNLLQYLKTKKIRTITAGIEDSTLLTDAITAGADYTLGNFVGEVQESLAESSHVESFELT